MPTVVTTGHLIARKRHADVLRAIAALPQHPRAAPPDRRRRARARGAGGARRRALGIADRVEFTGQLDPAEALERTRRAWLLAMPSTDEAFGVAYVEAMAGGLPAIAAQGEPGPEEILSAGGGLVARGARRRRRARRRDRPPRQRPRDAASREGEQARATVERAFSWERCGAATVAAYEDALTPGAAARITHDARQAVKPVLFVTNHVPPDRAGAFAALRRRVPLELAIFGGRSWHATAGVADPGVPHRFVEQREIRALAASRRLRARSSAERPGGSRCRRPGWGRAARACRSSCGPRCGRIRARRRTSWRARRCSPGCIATPTRSSPTGPMWPPSHALAGRATCTSRRRPSTTTSGAPASTRSAPRRSMRCFSDGRAGEKAHRCSWTLGVRQVSEQPPRSSSSAWDPGPPGAPPAARSPSSDRQPPEQVRNFLAAADVCVIPSLRTRSFREPWGLVANEAMNQSTAIIASDEVGAVAGGLVRHERNGLVVKAGDATALAGSPAAPARRPRAARPAGRQWTPRRLSLHLRRVGRGLSGRARLATVTTCPDSPSPS